MFRSFLRQAEIDDLDLGVRLSRGKQEILNVLRRPRESSEKRFFLTSGLRSRWQISLLCM